MSTRLHDTIPFYGDPMNDITWPSYPGVPSTGTTGFVYTYPWSPTKKEWDDLVADIKEIKRQLIPTPITPTSPERTEDI